jgi:hypothetical protein
MNMHVKDVLRIGGLLETIERPQADTKVNLEEMALPVAVTVDTHTYPSVLGSRKRTTIKYIITLNRTIPSIKMPVVHTFVDAAHYGDSEAGVGFDDLPELVTAIEQKVAHWDSFCMNGGLISRDDMTAIYDAWVTSEWVQNSHWLKDAETINILGDIHKNAIYPEYRNDRYAVSRREMTWAIQYLIDTNVLPLNALELDHSDWDNDMADAVFQVCCFGELVFG